MSLSWTVSWFITLYTACCYKYLSDPVQKTMYIKRREEFVFLVAHQESVIYSETSIVIHLKQAVLVVSNLWW